MNKLSLLFVVALLTACSREDAPVCPTGAVFSTAAVTSSGSVGGTGGTGGAGETGTGGASSSVATGGGTTSSIATTTSSSSSGAVACLAYSAHVARGCTPGANDYLVWPFTPPNDIIVTSIAMPTELYTTGAAAPAGVAVFVDIGGAPAQMPTFELSTNTANSPLPGWHRGTVAPAQHLLGKQLYWIGIEQVSSESVCVITDSLPADIFTCDLASPCSPFPNAGYTGPPVMEIGTCP